MPNISWSNGNQTMKFGQLNVTWETFFLKNHPQNVMEKLVPEPFLKNENWAYLWINSLKFYTVCFFVVWQVEGYRNILKLSCRTCFHLILSLELVSLTHFPHDLWRKIFLLLCSINWPNFTVWLPLLCEILGNMYIAIVCEPVSDVMNFEVNLSVLIRPFFLRHQNVVTKT